MQKEPPIKCFAIVVSSVAMQREMHRPVYGFRINFSCELLLAAKVQKAHAQTLIFFLFRDCSHGGSKILQGGARVLHITAANKVLS